MLSLDAFARAETVTNTFGGRAPLGPAVGASALPQTHSRNLVRGPTSKGKREKGRGR